MHQIAEHLNDAECWFTPYYADGALGRLTRWGFLENTILGGKHAHRCLAYLQYHDLPVDLRGSRNDYDLVVTCSDLVMPKNVRGEKVVLVQEGMTDPENAFYHLVKRVRVLPRWLSGTAATGLSLQYSRFCVASEGYRELFVRKGVPDDRIVVTGIPNFDNCKGYIANDFPERNYVLVCTSDLRETWQWERRKRFIQRAIRIAAGRPMIFKLHPNEYIRRATKEILSLAPRATVLASGNTEQMIANCDVLITRYSTTVFVGMALGKECYSDVPLAELRQLLPLQNGSAASNIASICRKVLNGDDPPTVSPVHARSRGRKRSRMHGVVAAKLSWGISR